MKFGFGFPPRMSVDESVNIVQAAESMGYAMAWIPDQTFYRDPFLVMAAWAQATSKIDLMLGVVNPYTRHPAQVARAIATVDEMSRGRAHLGIGAGNRRELLLPMGYEQTAAAERCREMAVIVRDLLRGETVRYRSEYVVADGITLDWKPHRPDLPIYIAGRGALTLEVAGEVADGAIIGALVSPMGLDYAFDAVKRGAERAGRSPANVKIVSWVTCIVTDDLDAIKDRIRSSVAHIIGGAPLPLLKGIGLEDDYVAVLKATYAEGGQAAAARHVTDREIDMLTVIGDAETVRNKIRRLAARGVDQVGILAVHPTAEATLAVLERIARDVIPHFA